MKADLAIYSHVVDASGQCMSVSLILGFKLDFSSCAIWDGFLKSNHKFGLLAKFIALKNKTPYTNIIAIKSLKQEFFNRPVVCPQIEKI